MKLEHNGLRYNLKVKGQGVPVVFLHGFSENMETFDEIDTSGYKAIYIDLLGHGNTDSPKSMKYYNVLRMVIDLHFIINKIVRDRYILYGYSMGGRIALFYSSYYKDEIDKLIIESASYGEYGDIERKNRRRSDYLLAKRINKNGIEWFEDYWSNVSIFNSQKMMDGEKQIKVSKMRLKNNVDGLTKALMGFGQGRNPCVKDEIINFNMSILYLCGEKDEKYASIGKEIEMLNSRVIRMVIAGAGHNVHIERPKEVSNIINNFIRKD